LTQGKQLFPKMGAIRVWLSWDSYIRNPRLFEERFDSTLQCAAKHRLVVMPVLFNRWHDFVLDYGGVYIDHLVLAADKRRQLFEPYLESIVGKHKEDPRIFAWDLCNEPVLTRLSASWTPSMRDAEYSWLTDAYATCKRLGTRAPLCIGTGLSLEDIELIEPISDIVTTHPYFIKDRNKDLAKLDAIVDFANRKNKPLLASETCWGSLDDQERAAIVQWTLSELKKRDIGWLAYVLHHSLIADAHRPEYGPMDHAGNLSFIEADGSLRPGHGVFNDF
jgi:endo-1,4-beta-mannosidase